MFALESRIALSAALTAVALLTAAAPSQAQATPIVTGEVEVTSPVIGPVGLGLSLVQLPSGQLDGQGSLELLALGGRVDFEVTSYMFLGDMVCLAGPVTAAVNAPPAYSLGATVVFCIEDNGDGGSSAPDTVAGTVGPPGLTIQQIIALIGPPPPQAFQPIAAGNFRIH